VKSYAARQLIEDRGAPHIGPGQILLRPERQLGERLRRRNVIAWGGTLRHRPLRCRYDGLAGAAIEHEQIASLGRLDDCRHNALRGPQID
jgi:hypothetical protein